MRVQYKEYNLSVRVKCSTYQSIVCIYCIVSMSLLSRILEQPSSNNQNQGNTGCDCKDDGDDDDNDDDDDVDDNDGDDDDDDDDDEKVFD